MKIAYMNPWEHAAESQAYLSLAAGAAKLEIELIDCRVAEDIENARPDFVISVASSIPKVADYPSYLTLHEPRRRFLENDFYLKNLLSYDGFLTISDRLRRFAKDVCFGVGRQTEVGFYYNTPQSSELHADIEAAVRDDRLRVGYFGTNWDRRLPSLFRTLDRHAFLQIHGPVASWAQEDYQSYVGPLPFDGKAPQRAYSQYCMGLVLLSADHLRDDVISNRIFEITSVGAAAICPDIPCIRKWFRDSVFYFDATRSVALIAETIHSHYEFCRNNPELVQRMASRARAVFEQQFCAERMLRNVAAYHLKIQQCRKKRFAAVPEPEISVIIRCGGRPVEIVRTAVDSVRRQTIGRFTIIFSLYAEIDLSCMTSVGSDRIVSFTKLLTPGGDRYATLVSGLKEVRTEYFAILDDDDFWLSDHVESLFSAARMVDPQFDVVFSGAVCIDQIGKQIERGLVWHRNIYTFGFRRPPASEWEVTGAFSSNCFIARSDLIFGGLSDLPSLETAEDSLLVALVTRRKYPVFSYKATAFFRRGHNDESGFASSPSRRRDVLSMRLRTSMLLGCAWLGQGSLQPAMDAWSEFAAENLDPSALAAALGAPKLGDNFSESWELIQRMSVGAAGKRISQTILRSRQRIEGYVCYGPYIFLPRGRYTVEIAITLFPRLRSLKDVGVIDVVSVGIGWEGATHGFTAAARKVSAPFEISDAVAGKPVEFRVWSAGLTVFWVRSIRLIRYE